MGNGHMLVTLQPFCVLYEYLIDDMLAKKKLHLTLSGGGARGAAHIGVIRALQEEGIEIAQVAGVSAGSIVGMLVAAGLRADEMMLFIREFSLYNMLHLGLPSLGVTDLLKLKEHLATVAPNNDFLGLKIPFFVGVTNLNTGQGEIHSSGPLHDLVAASCAIPFVFKPEPIGEYLYADGGITNNMVVAPLLDPQAVVLGVNVIPQMTIPTDKIDSMYAVLKRTFNLSIMANTKYSIEQCRHVIYPIQTDEFGIFDTDHLDTLHDLGYAEAKRQMGEIKASLGLT
ncbi:patatin-like phospholipase family protein [Lewinella sp. W8]|uniref:patatin-like phospholipase family protein n=1 Tax=Lewinella sp. W8 TaxID=2528208 RepID=UPI0010681BC8|nr:patatin-like phospholipase family protein [Lewinella sp. W8]MTB51247.1 hypothetical protein [Lewinella sp. W8]